MADTSQTPPAPPATAEPVPLPVVQAAPWAPPPEAVCFSLKRVLPGGRAEPCTMLWDGEVRARHPLPLPREAFLDIWGSGAYQVTFHGDDGKARGRCNIGLKDDAFPTKPAAAIPPPNPELASSGGNEAEPGEGEEEEEELDVDELEEELEKAEEENERLRRELDELKRGAATRAAPATPSSPYVPRARAKAAPPAERRTRRMPRRMGGDMQALEWFFFGQEEREREADRRLERMRVEADIARQDAEARHKATLREQEEAHKRRLETERNLFERERHESRDRRELRELREEMSELADELDERGAQGGGEKRSLVEQLPELLVGLKTFLESQKKEPDGT